MMMITVVMIVAMVIVAVIIQCSQVCKDTLTFSLLKVGFVVLSDTGDGDNGECNDGNGCRRSGLALPSET